MVSIASRARVECLTAEVAGDRALLQESSEITFSDEHMEVGYSNHKMPFYLIASINQIPIKRALVDTGSSAKSYPTKHSLSSGNFREEDSGILNGSDRIQGKRQVHHRPHSTMAEGGSNSLHGLLPCGKNGSLIPCASGKTMVTYALISPVYLSLVCEGKVEWQSDTHSSRSITI